MTTVTFGHNVPDRQDETYFASTKANQIDEGLPGSNLNGNQVFQIELNNIGTAEEDALIQMDFLSTLAGLIPLSSDINWATLHVYLSQGSNNTQVCCLHRLKRTWVVDEVNWNEYSTGNSWGTAGAKSSSDRVPSASDCEDTTGVGQEGFEVFTVTNDVKYFFDAADDSPGWILLTNSGPGDGGTFSSWRGPRSSSDSSRTYLTVDYTKTPEVLNESVSDGASFSETILGDTDVEKTADDGFTLGEFVSGGHLISPSASVGSGFIMLDGALPTLSGSSFASAGMLFSDVVSATQITSGGSSDTFTVADSGSGFLSWDESLSAGLSMTEYIFGYKASLPPTRLTWGENTADDYDNGTHDVYVASNFPDTNFNGSNIAIGGDDVNRGLAYFDFKSDLEGLGFVESDILSAGMKFEVQSIGGGITVNLRTLSSSFTEGSVTWNTQPSVHGGVSAAQPHGVTATPAGTLITYDVTSYVRRVLGGEFTNYGVQLRRATGDKQVNYQDSESSDGSRPYLQIAVSTEGDFNPVLSDGVSLGETVIDGQATSAAAIDGFLLGEEVSGAYRFPTSHTAADTLLMGEEVSGAYRFPTSHSVSAGLVMIDTGEDELFTLVVDGVTFGETLSPTATMVPSASDGIILSDSAPNLATFRPAISDGLLLGDVIANTVDFVDSVSAGMLFNDDADTNYPVFVTDGFVMSASAFAGAAWVDIISDTFTMGSTAAMRFMGSHKTITAEAIIFQFLSKGILQR